MVDIFLSTNQRLDSHFSANPRAGTSTISRCIDQDEIGKVFGGIALLAASIEFGSSPLYKIIFEKTKDWRPSSVQLVTTASILGLAGLLNLFIYSQLRRNKQQEEEDGSGQQEETKDGDIGVKNDDVTTKL